MTTALVDSMPNQQTNESPCSEMGTAMAESDQLRHVSMLQLLSFAERINATSARSLGELVKYLVPQLRRSIDAPWVGFFSAPHFKASVDQAIVDGYQLVEDGRRSFGLEDCISLIGKFAGCATERALRITRHPGGQRQCERSDTGFVLVRVYDSEAHWGWLVALTGEIVDLTSYGSPCQALPSDVSSNQDSGLVAVLQQAARFLAAQAVNHDLLAQRDEMLVNVVRTLISAIEAKDAFVRGHSERVAVFARMVAVELGLPAGDCERIYLAGLLHDVGKIGIPDTTLHKMGELTPEEFDQVKRHPEAGWQILQPIKALRHLLPGVLHHHERIDGQGYPDGLEGEQIPLDGRILAVVDAYDAMTSDRAYRAGFSQERAEQILQSGSGVQWDGKVIDALFRIMPEVIKARQGREPRAAKFVRRRTVSR